MSVAPLVNCARSDQSTPAAPELTFNASLSDVDVGVPLGHANRLDVCTPVGA